MLHRPGLWLAYAAWSIERIGQPLFFLLLITTLMGLVAVGVSHYQHKPELLAASLAVSAALHLLLAAWFSLFVLRADRPHAPGAEVTYELALGLPSAVEETLAVRLSNTLLDPVRREAIELDPQRGESPTPVFPVPPDDPLPVPPLLARAAEAREALHDASLALPAVSVSLPRPAESQASAMRLEPESAAMDALVTPQPVVAVASSPEPELRLPSDVTVARLDEGVTIPDALPMEGRAYDSASPDRALETEVETARLTPDTAMPVPKIAARVAAEAETGFAVMGAVLPLADVASEGSATGTERTAMPERAMVASRAEGASAHQAAVDTVRALPVLNGADAVRRDRPVLTVSESMPMAASPGRVRPIQTVSQPVRAEVDMDGPVSPTLPGAAFVAEAGPSSVSEARPVPLARPEATVVAPVARTVPVVAQEATSGIAAADRSAPTELPAVEGRVAASSPAGSFPEAPRRRFQAVLGTAQPRSQSLEGFVPDVSVAMVGGTAAQPAVPDAADPVARAAAQAGLEGSGGFTLPAASAAAGAAAFEEMSSASPRAAPDAMPRAAHRGTEGGTASPTASAAVVLLSPELRQTPLPASDVGSLAGPAAPRVGRAATAPSVMTTAGFRAPARARAADAMGALVIAEALLPVEAPPLRAGGVAREVALAPIDRPVSADADRPHAMAAPRGGWRMPESPVDPAASSVGGEATPMPRVRVGFAAQPKAIASTPAGGSSESGEIADAVTQPVGRAIYELRTPENRRFIEDLGGSPETEAAVEEALVWLAGAQSPDGRWDVDAFTGVETVGGAGDHADGDAALTGLSLLAYLGAGYTHRAGRHRRTVQQGLDWLIQGQGSDGDLRRNGQMYDQAMAAAALCEAYSLTGDPRLLRPATLAAEFIMAAQNPGAGWRYEPRSDNDTSVLGWQVLALKSAEIAGIPVPARHFEWTGQWLDKVRKGQGGLYAYKPGHGPTPVMTAEGWFCQLFMAGSARMQGQEESLAYLTSNLPEWDPENPGITHLYYWYYATLALRLSGVEAFDEWNRHLKEALLSGRCRTGPAAGSWDPVSALGARGGRVYSTAMATLCLEVYYRYLPFYRRLTREATNP